MKILSDIDLLSIARSELGIAKSYQSDGNRAEAEIHLANAQELMSPTAEIARRTRGGNRS